MTRGVLLDTHVLLWLDERPLELKPVASLQIADARQLGKLFVSDITLWELGVAVHRKSLERRPDLRGQNLQDWIEGMTRSYGIRILNLARRIAFEAAEVPQVYGSGDPGDCFLIATARVRNLTLATHDARILSLSKRLPNYLVTLAC